MIPDSDEALAAAVLEPALRTEALPGIGGRVRARLEDFEVEEIPAYEADGRTGAHLLVPLHKRSLSTEDAVRELARQLGLSRGEIGVAGKKDRDAVSRQWISVPARVGEIHVEPAPAVPDVGLAAGVRLRFTLPSGTYATVLARELMQPCGGTPGAGA